ncbi:MAG: helix-turn-helix domain-containing protein [Collinsella sp.]
MVEEFYHVSHEELVGKRRTANIAFARHVAVYLANNLCEMTTPGHQGAEFGGREPLDGRSTPLKVVENKMRADRRIVREYIAEPQVTPSVLQVVRTRRGKPWVKPCGKPGGNARKPIEENMWMISRGKSNRVVLQWIVERKRPIHLGRTRVVHTVHCVITVITYIYLREE